MSRAGRGALLLAILALAACAAAGPARAAGLNEGGVAFLSWSATDSISVDSLPSGIDTLYVHLALVHEVKGCEFTLRWSSPPCSTFYRALQVKKGIDPDCTWIPRWDIFTPPVPLEGPDSVFVFYATDTYSTCTEGVVAAFQFDFTLCSDSRAFCISYLKVVDGSNKEDSLTIIGDARAGTASVERPCGPLPPPRVDRIMESSAFYGTSPVITVSGFNFQPPVPDVWLQRAGYPSIPAESVTYVNASQLLAQFDLTTAPFGTWQLIVQNPDGMIEPNPPSFVILVPAALIDTMLPRVLYAGPSPGLATRVTVRGANFYPNPEPPTVRLESSRNVLTGTNTTLTSENELSTTFTIPDYLPEVSSADLDDHAFTMKVQNLNSPQAEYSRAIYVFRPPPEITDVTVTPVADSNFVEWSLTDATSGSRFVIQRLSYRCGVLMPNETRSILDSVFTRGTRFHYVDTKPLIGRSHTYTVFQTYLLGVDSLDTQPVTAADTVGVRCPAQVGILFLGSTVRPPTVPLRVLFTLSRSGPVRADVLDLAGRRVRVLTGTGTEVQLTWDGKREDGTRVAAGVYPVVVEAEGRSERRKVLVLP